MTLQLLEEIGQSILFYSILFCSVLCCGASIVQLQWHTNYITITLFFSSLFGWSHWSDYTLLGRIHTHTHTHTLHTHTHTHTPYTHTTHMHTHRLKIHTSCDHFLSAPRWIHTIWRMSVCVFARVYFSDLQYCSVSLKSFIVNLYLRNAFTFLWDKVFSLIKTFGILSHFSWFCKHI